MDFAPLGFDFAPPSRDVAPLRANGGLLSVWAAAVAAILGSLSGLKDVTEGKNKGKEWLPPYIDWIIKCVHVPDHK